MLDCASVMSPRRAPISPALPSIEVCSSEALLARSALVASTSSNSLSILTFSPPSSFLVAYVLLRGRCHLITLYSEFEMKTVQFM